MEKTASVQDSLDLIQRMLTPVRARAEKEAADTLNESGARKTDTSSSYQDASENTIEGHEKKDAVNSQTNLGTEQSQDAKDSGSTVEEDKDNTDELGKDFADTQGPQTLSTDDKVKDKGDLGPVARQEISQEQKLARAEVLGNAILDVIQVSLGKQAGHKPTSGGGYGHGKGETPGKGTQSRNYQTGVQDNEAEDGGNIAVGDGMDYKEGSQQKTAEEQAFDTLSGIAKEAAQEYYEGYMLGLLKRAQDEHEILHSGIPMDVIQAAGGAGAILDKVAMEFPEAVMPEGEMSEGAMPEGEMPLPEGGGEMPMPGGLEGEMPPMEGEMPPMEGEMPPMEGGGEMGMEGGPAEGELEALVSQLEEAGVTPEELEQAFADVDELQQAGVAPEELASALTEINDGGMEGAAPEMGAEPPMPEPGLDPAMPEGGDYKEASARKRVDDIKAYLTRKR